MSCTWSLELLFPSWKEAKIYLKNKVQRGIVALSPGGLLFLRSPESVTYTFVLFI